MYSSKFYTKVSKIDRAKWIFKHNSPDQLGYARENERIDIEKQVKLLFSLWDADGSGAIGVEEIVHGLIAIGLGGTPKFTEEVLFISL